MPVGVPGPVEELSHQAETVQARDSQLKVCQILFRTDLCAAKYGRMRSELDEAQLVIKMLEDQLEDHGICVRCELGGDLVTTNPVFSSSGCKEISEKETVL